MQMPPFEAFRDAESYYAPLAHECSHWTRHPSRLDRDFGRKKWGDEGYAVEELVAELGSAFLSADLDLTPEAREDHAAYIASWLKVLKNDKRAISSAASHAQRAAELGYSMGSNHYSKQCQQNSFATIYWQEQEDWAWSRAILVTVGAELSMRESRTLRVVGSSRDHDSIGHTLPRPDGPPQRAFALPAVLASPEPLVYQGRSGS